MTQGKTLIIVLVTLVTGFGAGFTLRPIIAPAGPSAPIKSSGPWGVKVPPVKPMATSQQMAIPKMNQTANTRIPVPSKVMPYDRAR